MKPPVLTRVPRGIEASPEDIQALLWQDPFRLYRNTASYTRIQYSTSTYIFHYVYKPTYQHTTHKLKYLSSCIQHMSTEKKNTTMR